MMNIIRICFASVMLMAASCATVKKYPLVKNGKPTSCIVLAENADPIEKHAAAELAMFIKKTSGAEVSVANKEIKGLYSIYLKTDGKLDVVSGHGFAIKSGENGLYITGKKPIGVLYGVYDFLEKYVGYRWFAPYEGGEFTPEMTTIEIASGLDDRQSPSFEWRQIALGSGNVFAGKGARNTWDWMARNKIQITVPPAHYDNKIFHDYLRERGAIIMGGGHELFTLAVPEAKYFASHPEYFAQIDGKRVPYGRHPVEGVLAQACTSNPDVLRLCAEYVLEFFEKYPENSVYLMGAGDNGEWCECETCRKLDPPGDTFSATTRFDQLVNAVTKTVMEKKPRADMWIWAYAQFREPPVGLALDPHLTVFLCQHGRNYKVPLYDPANEKYMRLLEQWQKLAERVLLFEYEGCSPGGTKFTPIWDALADDLRFYHKRKLFGWHNNATAPDAYYTGRFDSPDVKRGWRMCWQKYYLAAKMLWNVNADEGKILKEARALYYGKAAPAMENYYGALCEAWKKTPGGVGWGCNYGGFTQGKCLALPGVRSVLEKCLAEAETLAGNDKIAREKINEEKTCFQEYWVKNYEQYLAGKKSPLSAEKTSSAPAIDGKASDQQWNLAESLVDFVLMDGSGKKPANATMAKILFDEQNLYILIEALEKNTGELQMKSEKRDAAVWDDDCIEIFILNPRGQEAYYQFVINPKGCIFDAKWKPGMNGDYSYNADIDVKTAVLADRWVAEMKIPAASLAVSNFCEGSQWKINIARSRKAKGDSDTAEHSTISGYGNHDFDRFRIVDFGAPNVANGSFDEVGKPGKNTNSTEALPANWGFIRSREITGAVSLVARNEKTRDLSLQIANGWVFQYPPYQWTREKNISMSNILISCDAKGSGNLKFSIGRYKHVEPRFVANEILTNCAISAGEWKRYSAAYQRRLDETFTVGFKVEGTAMLDNVSIESAGVNN